MRVFLLNLVLAIVWVAFTGVLRPLNFAVGLGVGFAVLWLARPLLGATRYFERIPTAARFVAFFLMELWLSTWRVTLDVLRPHPRMRPGVVAVPLDIETDVEITLLGNMITLTPGTLTLDVSSDRRTLYLHSMYAESADAVRREIKEGFEMRIKELLR